MGAGYAGIPVAGGRAYLFHRVGDTELVEALDAATGASVWKDAGHPTKFQPQVGGGDGPLCTPVVAGDRVIVFGASGTLACLDATTGRRQWTRETHRDYGAPEGYFGAGSTPLVTAGRVVVNVGGAKQDAGLVAFDLATGETAWQALAEAAGYSAPVAVEVNGTPHVLALTRLACVLVDAATGEIRWRFPFGQRGPTVNAATPVVLSEGRLLVTAAYGIGTVCAAFDARAATPIWEGSDSLATQYCTPLLVAGHLYGIDGRDDVPPADFKCVGSWLARGRWARPRPMRSGRCRRWPGAGCTFATTAGSSASRSARDGRGAQSLSASASKGRGKKSANRNVPRPSIAITVSAEPNSAITCRHAPQGAIFATSVPSRSRQVSATCTSLRPPATTPAKIAARSAQIVRP